MISTLCKLTFSTQCHFGSDAGGMALGSAQHSFRADTFFSALCSEAAKMELLEQLYSFAENGNLLFSDAFPYCKEQYLLPKPILYLDALETKNADSNRKKAFKKLAYIPIDHFNTYLAGLSSNSFDPGSLQNEFGIETIQTRAAKNGREQTLPYRVGGFSFFDESGLYVVCKFDGEEEKQLVQRLIRNLGCSGIGGKTSSGMGKFSCEFLPLPDILEKMLDDSSAPYQMLLSTSLPTIEEMQAGVLENAFYTIVRRGGFIASNTYAQSARRKQDKYFLSAGSCLRKRFSGEIFDVGAQGKHPVWRFSKPLFMGVRT